MVKAWSILMAAQLVMPSAEPACPEGGACPVREEDTFDEVNMLQERRSLVTAASKISAASNSSKVEPIENYAFLEDCDVAYGPNNKHKVDVYWPEDTSLKPSDGWSAVIILPGQGNTRKNWKGFCTKYMVPAGRLCVAADYRQGDAYRADDVYKFAEWFYEDAKTANTWGVDKTKIVLGGASLGGLTINNVIWDGKKGKALLKNPPKFAAVMLLSGTHSSHHRKASKAKYFPGNTLIVTSDNDTVVPHKYSKQLYDALNKKNKPVKFVQIKDGGHAIWNIKRPEWYAALLAFLDEIVPTAISYT